MDTVDGILLMPKKNLGRGRRQITRYSTEDIVCCIRKSFKKTNVFKEVCKVWETVDSKGC